MMGGEGLPSFWSLTTSPAQEHAKDIASSWSCRPSGAWLGRAASSAYCKSKMSFVTLFTVCKRRIFKQASIELVLDVNAICSRDVVTKDEIHCHKEEVENSTC